MSNMTQENLRAYFEEYASSYMRGEAETIATRIYACPFLAVREGRPVHLATLPEVIEHLDGVMHAYRQSGARAAEIADLSVIEQGNRAALVTVRWQIRGADSAVIRELSTSYQLAHREEWRILSYVNHDLVSAG